MNSTSVTQHISLRRVAEMANATPQAVSNWRRRYDNFPEPVAGTDRRPLFDLEGVKAWLTQTGRYDNNPGFATRIWAFMDGLRATLPPKDALQVALAAVAWKTLSANEVDKGFTSTGGELVLPASLRVPESGVEDEAFTILVGGLSSWTEEHLRGPYADIFTPLSQALIPAGASFISIMLGGLLQSPENHEDLQAALDELLERAGSQDILSRTAPHVRSLAISLLDIRDGDTVLDPASGSSSLLLQVADAHPGIRGIGVELNEDQLRLGALAAIICGQPLDLRQGNSIANDPASDVVANRVFSDPPFGVRVQDSRDLQGDPRWAFGVPAATFDFAWVQHAFARLADDGRAAIVLPSSDMSSSFGRKIRSEMIKQAVVEAVIALPRGSYPGTTLAAVMFILRGPSVDKGLNVDGVLLIDASDDTENLEWLVGVLSDFRKDGHIGLALPKAVVVPLTDLLAEGANLVPARWLAKTEVADEDSLNAKILSVKKSVTELGSYRSQGSIRITDSGVPFVKLRELVESKSLRVVKGRSVSSEDLRDSGENAVLTPRLLAGDKAASRYADEWAGMNPQQLTQVGDIAVWVASARINAMVLGESAQIPGAQIQVLRIVDGPFDPEYLATCISSSHNLRFLEGAALLRPNILEFEIPSLSTRDQQEISQQMRAVAELEQRLAALAMETAHVRTLISDAVGEGRLRVAYA